MTFKENLKYFSIALLGFILILGFGFWVLYQIDTTDYQTIQCCAPISNWFPILILAFLISLTIGILIIYLSERKNKLHNNKQG